MNLQSKIKRYKTLKSFPGVRKEISSGRYLVEVFAGGKRASKSFKKLEDALSWQKLIKIETSFGFLGEERNELTFQDVWEKYKDEHLPSLEKSSQENKFFLIKFYSEMMNIKISEISPGYLSRFILMKKEIFMKEKFHRRKNFNQEIKFLNAIFNWYKEEVDYTFSNPVIKKHRVLGILSKEVQLNKKLSFEELKIFLDTLKEKPFWYDFALTQLLCAGRVQEIAGLQKDNLDFKNSNLIIKEVVVWDKQTKKFDHLKAVPKNGEIREVFLIPALFKVLLKRVDADTSNSPFVFHINGEPLSYRQIQYNYEWALQKSGLSKKYSGTHILRHSMATLTRKVTGSLNSAQAVTGHKDFKLVQHYAQLDSEENQKALLAVESFMNQKNFFD